MRGTHAWIESLRKTGRWDQPRFWRRPAYQAMSPWSPEEHKLAFEALRVVYPPDEVRRIFARTPEGLPPLAPLLMDPVRPDLSGLLALGFDAAHARIERYPGLIEGLRGDKYPGARLELAILAALERQRIRYEYEPFARESREHARRGASFPNPDLRVHLGCRVIVDIKHMQLSERANRSLRRFMLLQQGPGGGKIIGAGFELTPRFARLEQGDYSEERLDRLALRLHRRACERAEEMRVLGIATDTIGGGLMKLDLDRVGSLGVPLDDPRDAARIVRRLDDAAAQIPRGERGIALVEPGASDPFPLVYETARRWLELAKPEMVGVVLLAEQWVLDAGHTFKLLHPIWRPGAPAKLRKAQHWNRLALGLNWRALRTMKPAP